MRRRTTFPFEIEETLNVWIPMRDGTRLSARIWRPKGSERSPVPAILEYLPYRKNDDMAVRDSVRHPYFAGHGYASIRVDMRGTGDSDGILYDEYLPKEQEDALEILSWLAAQPWCTGSIGMFGISWGGFNGLQVASLRPTELKAVISLCSTDDRYADDVHYKGGCVLASEMLPWASTMLAWNALPPDPDVVGESWRKTWLERIDETPPYIEKWLAHQQRDAYWKHGSICEDFSSIEAAVMLAGGFADGYTNAIPRMLAGLSCPRKGLIGPWAHTFPEEGPPGPTIGFLQECLRWWDRWLKGIETGVENDPILQVWMQNGALPKDSYELRDGRWAATREWPPRGESSMNLYLCSAESGSGRGALDERPSAIERRELPSELGTLLNLGNWCAYGDSGSLPGAQNGDDLGSLVYISEPLSSPIDVLGFPRLACVVSSDRGEAQLFARLYDIFPDGTETLVSYGALNLSHRISHEKPSPLEPGGDTKVELELDFTGHSFAAGHRIGASLSQSGWPLLWPSSSISRLAILEGPTTLLSLPLLSKDDERQPIEFMEPEGAEPLELTRISSASALREARVDLLTGSTTLTIRNESGRVRLERFETEMESRVEERFILTDGDPDSAKVVSKRRVELGRGDWRVLVETESTMESKDGYFVTTNTLTASENGETVRSIERTYRAPRKLV